MSAPETATVSSRTAEAAGRVELVISRLLRGGVLLSMTVIFAGLVLMFAHHPDYLRSSGDLQRLTSPGAAFPHTLREVADGLVNARGQAVVVVGLLLLIATPILRVAVSVIAFAVERDRIFVLITSVVLAVLLLSFLVGKGE
jgi:uncharacterized membrane protein